MAEAAALAAEELQVAGERSHSTTHKFKRLWRHRLASARRVRAVFDEAALDRVQSAVAEGENLHRGEIHFAVEAELDLYQLWASMTPRERALQVFAEQGIWDTEENTGVLIYLLWADHDVEIIADRGAHRILPAARWDEICATMARACRDGRHVDGVVSAIRALNEELRVALPAQGVNPDELPNRPTLL